MSDNSHDKASLLSRMLPGLTLMLLAPLDAEILTGATRMSVAHFVFPIEVVIWGGGTVLIREVVRRLRLGWINLVLLAMALSIAEEFVIQQTSIAPLVIKLKGIEYARAFGVNYVYFVWALIYEVLFVVLVPIGLAELIFWRRRNEGWLSGWGIAFIAILFLPACRAAWFGWTQIARIKVFHMDPYSPPLCQVATGVVAVIILILLAVGPTRRWMATPSARMRPPNPAVLFVLGGCTSMIVFLLEVLAFGWWPECPPAAVVVIGIFLATALAVFLSRFWVHEAWNDWHTTGMLYGAIFTNMAITFVSVQYAPPFDFYGKVIANLVAVLLLGLLAYELRNRNTRASAV